jgi:hypothetical protein
MLYLPSSSAYEPVSIGGCALRVDLARRRRPIVSLQAGGVRRRSARSNDPVVSGRIRRGEIRTGQRGEIDAADAAVTRDEGGRGEQAEQRDEREEQRTKHAGLDGQKKRAQHGRR